MRINKFVAQATGLSRRAADSAIREGRVAINNRPAAPGDDVATKDTVSLDGQALTPVKTLLIMLNKPAGYVCSRAGQGNRTVYELLPVEYHGLKPVGRLDKDSSGLLLLTNNGQLANRLTHPRYAKTKTYEAGLDKPLAAAHRQMITDGGVQLEDGLSQLTLAALDVNGRRWQITMQEGRNRQIRRTFTTLGYNVTSLHRNGFGPYQLAGLPSGQSKTLPPAGPPDKA